MVRAYKSYRNVGVNQVRKTVLKLFSDCEMYYMSWDVYYIIKGDGKSILLQHRQSFNLKMVKMSISLQHHLSVMNEEGHIIQYVALKLFSEEDALENVKM